MKSKKRLCYALGFALLLLCEVCIGLFVRDRFIRPYMGDMLVTVLLCCLGRWVFPEKFPSLPVWVFVLSAAVEFSQLWGLSDRLGIENRLIRVLLGTSFDWKDILCYFCGCVLFVLAEKALRNRLRKEP